MLQQIRCENQKIGSKEDLVRHYKEVRARLMGGQTKPEPESKPKIKIEIIQIRSVSAPERIKVISIMGPKTKGNLIIKKILLDNQISREEVFSLSRKHKLIFIRAHIWTELHKIGMSLPQIGRFCRPEHPYDHTTILNGVRKFPKYVQQAKERELVHVA
jgi:chromosomal replication initiation ATPase DnaA